MTIQTPFQTDQATSPPPEGPAKEYIGFVGCAKAGLLKVRVTRKACEVMRVACSCGEAHIATDPMIRERLPGEAVALIADETPIAVNPTTPLPNATVRRGRQQVSDAVLIAAIPADREVRAGEVAEELNYSSAKPLLDRMRRMNQRAKDKGEREPFHIIGTPSANTPHAGRMLRRNHHG